MNPLNLKALDFCNRVGVTYHTDIVRCLRELGLVTFFKVGKKYMYATEDAEKISNMLRKGEIFIKTDKGYYIALNKV